MTITSLIKKGLMFMLLVGLFPLNIYSAEEVQAGDYTDTSTVEMSRFARGAEAFMEAFTIEKETINIGIYPIVSYSDRTGLNIGASPVIQFMAKEGKRPTVLTPAVLFSTKRMFEVQLYAEVFFDRSNLLGQAEFFRLPDVYYANGHQLHKLPFAEYNYNSYWVTIDYTYMVAKGFSVGICGNLSYYKFSNVASYDTSYNYVDVVKAEEGWNNALGVAVAYDTRDDVIFPRKGWNIKAKFLGYAKLFGSFRNYSNFTIDARRYLRIKEKSCLAFQAYWSGMVGTAPFYKLPTYGGIRMMRSIPHSMKYADNYAWLFQSEVRFPIIWRIGAAVFVAAGNVSEKIFKHAGENAHAGGGVGLRLKVFPNSGMNLRLDYGYDNRKEHAIYFSIREAF